MVTTKLQSAILAGALSIAAAASARSDNRACPTADTARIQVNVTPGQEHVEAGMSLQQLREAAQGHHPGPVLGAYVGSLRYGIEIDDTGNRIRPVLRYTQICDPHGPT
jgi:hypothetical protein